MRRAVRFPKKPRPAISASTAPGYPGLEKQLKPGDVIGIQFGRSKDPLQSHMGGRCRASQKIEAGVKMLEGQPCPWQKELETPPQAARMAPRKRRHGASEGQEEISRRQKVPLSIEIRDEQGGGAAMKTKTADVNGRGCYVETMLPFPVGKVLTITFWLGSEQISTPATVRTCDGGVGMGIEFTGLDQRLRNGCSSRSMPWPPSRSLPGTYPVSSSVAVILMNLHFGQKACLN